jgi:hypothetical protein
MYKSEPPIAQAKGFEIEKDKMVYGNKYGYQSDIYRRRNRLEIKCVGEAVVVLYHCFDEDGSEIAHQDTCCHVYT